MFRDAAETDAAFILSLRTDEKKARFLSQVTLELAAITAVRTRYAKFLPAGIDVDF